MIDPEFVSLPKEYGDILVFKYFYKSNGHEYSHSAFLTMYNQVGLSSGEFKKLIYKFGYVRRNLKLSLDELILNFETKEQCLDILNSLMMAKQLSR